ncbi:MAG: hypothetical protein U9N49_08280, partial [Campylobacterota bacterium]|nr:hypothetical protein [Campylobacterota bacterium]
KKLFLVFFSFFIFLGFGGCNSKPNKPLTIVVNPWIGYIPFFYMQESGWLENKNIKVSSVVSLIESVKMIESGMADAMGGTQIEFNHLNNVLQVEPYLFLDRSNGADAIFANRSIDEIKRLNKPIEVFLEKGSINELMLELFAKKYKLELSHFYIQNFDQYTISRLALQKDPIMIITYEPYLEDIKKNGYRMIANSNDEGFNIIDVLIVTQIAQKRYQEELKLLHTLYRQAIQELQKDPQAFYEKIKVHLDGQSYDDFIGSIRGIEWIYDKNSALYLKLFKSS